MALENNVYISDLAEKVIGIAEESLSERINSICIRYGAIMASECPALTVSEWMSICDVLNSTGKAADNASIDIARFVWTEIEDACRFEGLGEKWGIDAKVLSIRLRKMPYSQQCAIIEVVTRFWLGHAGRNGRARKNSSNTLGRRLGSSYRYQPIMRGFQNQIRIWQRAS